METKYFGLQQKEKNQELRIEKIRGTVNPADLMTKHLDGKRCVMLCDLLSIRHISGGPSSAPKLETDTEYISRASRALTTMTSSSERSRRAFWSRKRNVDRWIQNRLLDNGGVENRVYHDLLDPDGSGTAVVEIWKSC